MRKLLVFNSLTVDGYFTDMNGDMSWAHKNDPEWNEFVEENASGGGVLVFGRITYEMMKNFWPTPMYNIPNNRYLLKSIPLLNNWIKVFWMRGGSSPHVTFAGE